MEYPRVMEVKRRSPTRARAALAALAMLGVVALVWAATALAGGSSASPPKEQPGANVPAAQDQDRQKGADHDCPGRGQGAVSLSAV